MLDKRFGYSMANNKFDVVVIGAGFAGATAARLLAEQNKSVLVIEERNHIGGNSFDAYDENGILIHKYGPHIFHTNEKRVFDFLSRFTEFFEYKHKVKGNIDGKIVPIPFNFTSIEICFGEEKAKIIKKHLKNCFKEREAISIFELLDAKDEVINELGRYVFDKVFAQYTAKQWGVDISQVDKSVINRVPVVLGYDDCYFKDKYQFMPNDGFTGLIKKMLDHPNILVLTNANTNDLVLVKNNVVDIYGEPFDGQIVFTGQIDRFFGYEFGRLPYRSLRFVFETHQRESYQEAAVVNYNTSEDFTRITEFKKITQQKVDGRTSILKEYPIDFNGDNPCYPIINETNNSTYQKYVDKVKKISGFYLCGRLAEYKYYNMDKVVSRAMDVVEEMLRK